MLKIKDSVAVITGGGSGLGLELARYWITSGGKVVLADISSEALEKASMQFAEAPNSCSTIVCDVTKEQDCSRLADAAIEQFGEINLIAPFAGIIKDGLMLSPDRETGKITKKMSLDDFKMVVDLNLTGVFLTVRECAERMINHNCKGLICLVSSTGSLGTAGQVNYSSTKAAMSVLPKVITAEFFRRKISHRIRCVAVAPGYCDTAMARGMNQKALDKILLDVPICRLIDPSEFSSLVGELFRNEALAGDVFFIHGGLRLGSRG
jgi:3-oxoacyl-[acyl-carrier protein] reductase